MGAATATVITETVDLEQRALTLPEQAAELTIVDDAGYTKAGDLLTRIKTLRGEIADTFDPIIKKAHEAHKEALAQKARIETPLVKAESLIKPKIASYHAEQDRKRREEEARLLAEQKKVEEDARIAEAANLEKAGESEMAERVLDEPPMMAPVVLPPTPKVQGITVKKVWKGRFDNLDLVIKAAAEGDRLAKSLLLGNQSALDALARSLKENFKVPGCRAYTDSSVAAGRR